MLTDQDYSLYSDMHKDAYGFRPVGGRPIMTQAEFDAAIDSMQRTIIEDIAHDKVLNAQAWLNWKTHIRAMMANNGIDLRTAIRWDMQAEQSQDIEFYAYEHGLDGEKTYTIQRFMGVER